MTTNEQLVVFGVVVLGLAALWKYGLHPNVHTPAKTPPANSGVSGSSPKKDSAAPLSTGDFARQDRAVSADSGPLLTTGEFARLDRSTALGDVPPVSVVYAEPVYSSPL